MPALTLYQTSTNDTLVTTARQLSITAPASETSVTQKTGKSINWGEHQSQGNTTTWSASASELNPTGHGWIWDVTTLEGQQIAAGTWTFKVKLGPPSSGSQTSCTIACRAYVRSSAGAFTQIVDAQLTGQTIGTAAAIYTVAGTGTAQSFGTGDKLYVDLLVKIGANSSGSTTATTPTFENLSTNESIVTPGYAPQPVSGSGGVTSPAVALSASGVEAVGGSGAERVAKASLSASGSVAASVSGSGRLTTAHAALSAAGSEAISGTANLTAKHSTIAASGAEAISASGGLSAKHTTISAAGAEQITGSGSETVGKATLAASGTSSNAISGSGSVIAARSSFALSGTLAIAGTGAVSAKRAAFASSGQQAITASGGVTLGHPSLQGVGAASSQSVSGAAAVSASVPTLIALGYLGLIPTPEVPVPLDRPGATVIQLESGEKSEGIDIGRTE